MALISLSTRFLLLASYLAILTFALDPWSPPLSTTGRYIIDASGDRFKFKSANWHGASGTYKGEGDRNVEGNHHSNENAHDLPLGLEYVHMDRIIDEFEASGLNSIRLPFSNELLRMTHTVQDSWVAANPQLRGLTPLQVFDRVVEALTARGFAVILNNHTNKSRWCCGIADGNEMWDESQSEDAWINDWVTLVRRYRSNPRVVGADLYNEVRRNILSDPTWGGGGRDWYRASQRAGDRILLDANPDILIIVEGINWTGLPIDGFAHDRPTLVPAGRLSHTFVVPNKLVYSAHFYAYTGPRHSGATGIGETTDPRYRDLSLADLHSEMRRQATYVALDADKHYTAPVWLSEFGVNRGASGKDFEWFDRFINYLVDNDIDFSYWPLTGLIENGNGNNWAIHNWDRARNQWHPHSDDNRWALWQRLTNNTRERKGRVNRTATWTMLSVDNGDAVQSRNVRNRGDWDSGATKAVCPDGQRLIGMSNAAFARGLCTDVNLFDADLSPSTVGVWGQEHNSHDWAGGFTKLECPTDHYVIGYSNRGSNISGALCVRMPNGTRLSGSGRTVWFDRSDQQSVSAGDFAPNQYKGTCAGDEILTGIAYRRTLGINGSAAAIYCRKRA